MRQALDKSHITSLIPPKNICDYITKAVARANAFADELRQERLAAR